MENASKALLIAGAILIAILLIAIGMMVFNNANGTITSATANMSAQEKQAFNRPFKVYEGQKSGTIVRELIEYVNVNNSNTDNAPMKLKDSVDSDLIVKSGGTDDNPLYKAGDNLKNQSQYQITFSDDEPSGKVDGLLDHFSVVQK